MTDREFPTLGVNVEQFTDAELEAAVREAMAAGQLQTVADLLHVLDARAPH